MIEEFLAQQKLAGKSELTIRQYRSSLARFASWWQEQTPYQGGTGGGDGLGQATEIDVANFKKWASRNLKPNTVRQTLTHLKAYFDYLVNFGIIPDNPVQHVKSVTTAKMTPKWLTRNEQNALIRAVRRYGDLRDLAMITVLLHAGLRVQELCDLRLQDVIIGERKGLAKVLGKHNRYREVPLNKDIREILSLYLQQRKCDSEYLFPNNREGQMTTRNVQHIIAEYRRLTGIDHLTAHALRHSFCHELVTRKVPLDVVARLAGHIKNDGTSNIAMTLVYTQPGEEDLQRAVEELSWR
ncbi:tyrosine-type recombinase/integrase [Desulforamulus aquiferis]|uniref:Tyrosine-type recombinase/integrase n=1 Tax=Desulforamulus aquiferis TaxID=1397668 RepID=A0AAW7ZCE4_9FIRM|nr:tyrosine-type recombinase/integrase [Desulforamulus aquiferis]MDO7786997.1 tyrosine-type recombinase/integrase [Desulforamulus aquiferis]